MNRAEINLHSDVLEHPDFFWEVPPRGFRTPSASRPTLTLRYSHFCSHLCSQDDMWLNDYLRVNKYLEVERRVEASRAHSAPLSLGAHASLTSRLLLASGAQQAARHHQGAL